MASQLPDLSKDEIEGRWKTAATVLRDLEVQLIEARAEELYWRRALRKAVFSGLAAEYGGDIPSSLPDEDAPSEPAGGASGPCDSEAPEPPRPPRAKRPVRPAGTPDRPTGPDGGRRPPREKRPKHGTDGVCIACWAAERGKAAGVAHLYEPPCLRTKAERGKWAKGKSSDAVGRTDAS